MVNYTNSITPNPNNVTSGSAVLRRNFQDRKYADLDEDDR
eukprot:UN05180